MPDVNNLNWVIHSYKGSDRDKNDGNLIQQVLQVVIRRLLKSTNTFILCNTAVKKTTLFQKEANQLSAVKTVSDLMVLSFDEAKLIYNEYWGRLSKAERKNRPISNWMSGPNIGIWYEENLVTTNGFFYQTFMNHFADIKGFSATDDSFHRKSFYNQITPIEFLLENEEYDLVEKIFGLSREDFCSLPENFLRTVDK